MHIADESYRTNAIHKALESQVVAHSSTEAVLVSFRNQCCNC